MQPLTAKPAAPLSGTIRVPGDKSISHRAVLLGSLAVGETRIRGLLEGEDVLRTLDAARALGALAEKDGDGTWRINGTGIGGLVEPDDVIDLGNSGTAARLLMGVLAAQPFLSFMTGDHSLRSRPMARVCEPLKQTGADIRLRQGNFLPAAITGAETPLPLCYELPVPSAQVKSAIILAGLHGPGETTVIEPQRTRDHTERMIRHFGGEVRVDDTKGGGRRITVVGQPELVAADIEVPGDISSAAFPLVAALIAPGSMVRLQGIGLNPGRTGLLTTLQEMGAAIEISGERVEGGEPVGDLEVSASPLEGIEVPAERAPSMIDEYPILAMAAAAAHGTTVMHGLAELRVKESDRLGAVVRGLAACGVATEEAGDSLIVHGVAGKPKGGATVETFYDHRIAMSFLVLGGIAERPVTVDDSRAIATSFPSFVPLMGELGAKIAAA